MSDSEKMNALDFVISVLREHESTLDNLIEKLENALKALSPELREAPSKPQPKTNIVAKGRVNILCEDWNEFAQTCTSAEKVSFQINEQLRIKALLNNVLYRYEEPIQSNISTTACGIPMSFQPNIEASVTRKFIAKELNIPEERIIRGDISF
jgi:hypothetical protein